MAPSLRGKTIAFLGAPDGVEQSELTEPWSAVERAGGQPELISTQGPKMQTFNHLDRGDEFGVDRTIKEAARPARTIWRLSAPSP